MKKGKFIRTNFQIRVPKIHLIDETGKSLGIIETEKARNIAFEKGLDLVEIVPHKSPPICKIMDFGKYKYQQEKSRKKQQKLSKSSEETKEIRLSLNISDHDLEIKKKRASRFLAKNCKIRIFLKLTGREFRFLDRAREILENFANRTDGQIEIPFKKEGNILSIVIAPAKK